ncbi:sensor histidine kinase [Vagococcus sp. BWB3-3]|uniref:histidine kinase n=1 Tax=Vagococcus allomyrinae TaxID=2794353 RepID=A0A940P8N0_9ENTE|nr:sensor histidine kinase [Vagococcus allomyrinae]
MIVKRLLNRNNILTALIPCLLLVSVLLTWFGYRGLTKITKENGQNFIFQSVQFFSKALELSIENKKEDVNNLIFDDSLINHVYDNLETKTYESHLKHIFQSSNNEVNTIVFLDTSGNITTSYHYDNQQITVMADQDVRQFVDGHFPNNYYSESDGTSTGKAYYIGQDSYMNIYQEVRNDRGEIRGTIIVPVNLQLFFEKFLSDFELSYNGYPVVKNRKMDYIMHPSTERVGQSIVELRQQDSPDADVSDLEQLEAQQLSQQSGKVEFYSYRKTDDNQDKKRRRIGAFQWIDIGDDSWLVMIDADYREVTRDIAEMGFVIATLFVMVIIGCLIALVALKKIQDKEKVEKENQFLKELQARKDELHEKEKKLYEMSKMETIGIVTTTIVHDMNNFLTPIIANAELIAEGYTQEDEQYDDLQEILKAARIGKEMSTNILRFSKNSEETNRQHLYDVSDVIREAVAQVASIIPESINFEVEIEKDLGMTQVERVDIQNLVYNLLKNAYQSNHGEQGKIFITLKKVSQHSLAQFLKRTAYHGKDDMGAVLFEVRDTGTGMSKEIQEQIYEPFFTTKNEDEGTGLGLFVVSSIVKKYDWQIKVASKLGEGTTISVTLPYYTSTPSNS